MAFKLFGIAKPNTYASSWHKKAEGNVSEDDSEERQRKPKRDKGGKGTTGGPVIKAVFFFSFL